jgi:bacterioferritin (cytochrome b1)
MIVCSCNVLTDSDVRMVLTAAQATPRTLRQDEEDHIDFLETQLDLVSRLGVELYSQHHIGKPDDADP